MNAVVLTALAVTSLYSAASEQSQKQSLLVTDIGRVHNAVNQLVHSQLSSGLFPYDFNFETGQESDMGNIDGLNLVRQTGAAFAIAEYLSHFDHAPTKEALKAFLKNTVSNSISIDKGFTQSALEWIGFYNRWQLWSSFRKPLYTMGLLFSEEGNGQLVSANYDYERAWPGATALSMVAALKYYEATGDSQFNAAVTNWKDGLLALKVARRGFREAPHYLTESAYVNGEAWLAFAELERIFPGNEESRTFLQELDDYMIQVYGNSYNNRFYHWGTMAAVVRAETTKDTRFTDFIYGLTKRYLDDKTNKTLPESNSCGAVEGLATFVMFMREQGRAKDPLVLSASDYINQVMVFNRKLQIGESTLELLPNADRFIDKLKEHRGAFIKSPTEPLMQVDLTQHCLNALLRMEKAGLTR